MPKAKSDQVITHRIELQNTERELLETAVLANAAGKTLSGVAMAMGTAIAGLGQMIAPAMGALTAWYIADKTIDEIREIGERQKSDMEENLAETYEGTYGLIVAWFNGRSLIEVCQESREAGVIDFTWTPKNKNKILPELVNASKKPGEWQTYDIIFKAPVFNENGEVKSPAYITVFHNGVLIQNNSEIQGYIEHTYVNICPLYWKLN